MLQLNDDCLLHIFRELSFRDQLIVAGVCVRFRDVIVKLLWRSRFHELCIDTEETNTLTEEEYQELFALIALNLEKLTIMGRRSYLRLKLTFYFTFKFPFLLELNCQDHTLNDEHVRLIAKNCVNLRVLRLSSRHVTGKYMKGLLQLQKLYVPECNLEMLHLEAIRRKLRLTDLALKGNIITRSHLKPPLAFYFKFKFPFLHINNTSSFIGSIARNFSLLDSLRLPFAPQFDIDFSNAFWLTTLKELKELHLVHEKLLLTSLPLIRYCVGLEHIYLEGRIYLEHDGGMHPTVFNWADRLIQLLQSQATSRPVLNVHITEYAPEESAQKLIKQLDDLYPQPNVVKWIWEPMSTSSIHEGRRFVSFEFE